MRVPDEPTTKEQWTVITWMIVALFALSSIVAFYYSTRATALGKLDIAVQLRWIGFAFVCLAVGVLLIRRLILRIVG